LALPLRTHLSWRRGDAGDPFELLRAVIRRVPQSAGAKPYSAGLVVLLSYELRHVLEELPGRHRSLTTLPDLLVIESRVTLVRDERTGEGRLNTIHGGESDPDYKTVLAQRDALRAALNAPRPRCDPKPISNRVLEAPSDAHHERRVQQALEHIRAGDIYQANLARRWTLERPSDLIQHHIHLRQANPPTFGAYLEHDGEALLSYSPEEFLAVDGERVSTRPIKGTCPRAADPVTDRNNQAALLASTKDRAELAMIVDVLRNDLSRVCRTGSVRVTAPLELETHPTVHHLVAEIEGHLAEGRDLVDLLRAVHPGGSITGAPRIRAMEIIDSLEAETRGPYCGALGWVGCDGRSRWNILIRTLYSGGGTLHLHAGGGIVLDSVPAAEREETTRKVAALLGHHE